MVKRLDEATRALRQREIASRTAAGESQRRIAEALGVSRSLVQKELRRMPAVEATPTRHSTNVVPADRRAKAAQIVKAGSGFHLPAGVGNPFQTIMPPPDHYSKWRTMDLDRDTWSKANPTELVSLLVNISPEMSRAVWDYLRLLNSGHEITAHRVGTDRPDPRAQAAIDEFVARLEEYHGSFKIIAGRLFMAAITRGAFFSELVLDEAGRMPIDLATPDPATVRFRLQDDPERGTYWQAGQWQGGKFVAFETPTVRYMPLDPEAGNPYGRPMLGPAIFPTVFLLGLLHDLRRVVAQQGYPRTNIIVKLEGLRETYRDLGMEEFEKKIDQILDNVAHEYSHLEPDDAYAHTDDIAVDRANGAVDTSVIGGAAKVIESLERMCVRALKTMPLLFGTPEGQSEGKSNREWEVFSEYISHLQHLAETMLGRHMELALQVQGINADVEVRFAGVRSADELRDQQILEKRIANAERAEALGYMERDEASEHAVGHAAATDAPVREAPETDDGEEPVAEPGEDRALRRLSRATDDVWADPHDDAAVVDEARMRSAMETWEDAFDGEPEETLLEATVAGEDEA